MSFFKILDKLKKKQMSLILYCLLDRIPIIVFGDKSDKIDKSLIELSELVHFRKEFVFYTDFISKREYNSLIQNESIDYNSQRVHIRCPNYVAMKALNQFDNFHSWVIGIVIPKEREKLYYVKDLIRRKAKVFLSIFFYSNNISVELEGINIKLIDLALEQKILQKIYQDTENAIDKMKRVVSENAKFSNSDENLINTLLDFEEDKKELKKNIFKREIQNFYSGSKRAFFILSKLNLLNNFKNHAKIESKTLLETIDYEEVPMDRILSFINKEWGENFSNLIDNGKKMFMTNQLQSLWG